MFSVRPFIPTDREGVRRIYGDDEFARPEMQKRFPRMSVYLADSMAHYYDLEPESAFVAEANGQVVGALLGSVDTNRTEGNFKRYIRPWLCKRVLTGVYGCPAWLWAEWRTDLAGRKIDRPPVDLGSYPAHLHIGILPGWRRKGIGMALMEIFENHLRSRSVPGYHLHASSFHPMGVAFYQKFGLEISSQFGWRFHNGYRWLNVLETVFVKRL